MRYMKKWLVWMRRRPQPHQYYVDGVFDRGEFRHALGVWRVNRPLR